MALSDKEVADLIRLTLPEGWESPCENCPDQDECTGFNDDGF